MSLDAMKQALAALEEIADEVFSPYDNKLGDAILALRAAIEQAQEPVAWVYVNTDGECEQIEYIENDPMPDDPSVTPLYTAPPPRQWQGLTDEEIDALEIDENGLPNSHLEFAWAIEAKLKEKNA